MGFWREECHVRFFFSLLASHWSVWTKIRKDPPNVGLFIIKQNVRLIKEDLTKVILFLSIIPFNYYYYYYLNFASNNFFLFFIHFFILRCSTLFLQEFDLGSPICSFHPFIT